MKRLLLAIVVLTALGLSEYLLETELADRGLVAALLAAGAHSSLWAVGWAVGFLGLRLLLLIGLPAVAGAILARHALAFVISATYARRAARRTRRALSSAGHEQTR